MSKKILLSSFALAAAIMVPALVGAQTIATVSPTNVNAGVSATPITVNGTGFVSGSTVSFNGITVPTAYVSSTQLTAMVPAASLAAAGDYAIYVTNPGSTALSNAVIFMVNGSNGNTTGGTTTPGLPDTGLAPSALSMDVDIPALFAAVVFASLIVVTAIQIRHLLASR